MVADGYGPYQTVARAGPDGVPRYTLAFCWAHVRRKYVKAEVFEPACAEVIELIGKLCEVERDLPNPHALTAGEQKGGAGQHPGGATGALCARGRGDQGVAGRQQGLPDSTFRKAIKYMLDLWHGLTVFLENPWVPPENNLVYAVHGIAAVVIGRQPHVLEKVGELFPVPGDAGDRLAHRPLGQVLGFCSAR